MPRPNQPRSIKSESALAARIAYERERSDMSYETLAQWMDKAGCPIQASAIYKIEKADPPRRITVDELVGFSRVFGVDVEKLLLPVELVAHAELSELVTAWDHALIELDQATRRRDQAWDAVVAQAQSAPAAREALQRVLSDWAADAYPDHQDDAASYFTALADGTPNAMDEWVASQTKGTEGS